MTLDYTRNGLWEMEGTPDASSGVPDYASVVLLRRITIPFGLQPSVPSLVEYDDFDTRGRIWRLLFGEVPMPRQEDGAVEKYFGSLDREVEVTRDIQERFDQILRRARGRRRV